jgi:glucose-1-phosphate thymidylyltransferase
MLDALQPKIRGKVSKNSVLHGKVAADQGSSILNSVILGPVIIGKNTRIIDSHVGPFVSLYHDVLIENSKIENSIILAGSKIENMAKMADSLIGKDVVVSRHLHKAGACRFMLGDSSQVEIS